MKFGLYFRLDGYIIRVLLAIFAFKYCSCAGVYADNLIQTGAAGFQQVLFT